MLKMLNLEGLETRFPRQLSGGQQQRTAIARALIMGQDILLLDEPLSNLDAKLRVEVRVELRQIQQKLKNTTIYVTHDQDEALSMSDIIAVMRFGGIEQVGTPWEIYYHPANRFVAEFVGTVNFVEAHVVNQVSSTVTVNFWGGHMDLYSETEWNPNECVILVVRPESIRLEETENGSGVRLTGKIVNRSFLGRMTRYWIKTEEQIFIVDDLNPSLRVDDVSDIVLILDTTKIHILANKN
jgi:ABC-type Fe3+/spermidine/putrescine transport system ATPase subunit